MGDFNAQVWRREALTPTGSKRPDASGGKINGTGVSPNTFQFPARTAASSPTMLILLLRQEYPSHVGSLSCSVWPWHYDGPYADPRQTHSGPNPWRPRAATFHHPESGLSIAASETSGGPLGLFRDEMVQIFVPAIEAWTAESHPAVGAAADALCRYIQHRFEGLTTPPWCTNYVASAIVAVVRGDACAFAKTGLDRGYRIRAGVLTQLTKDVSALDIAPSAPDREGGVPEHLRELLAGIDGTFFSHSSSARNRGWQVTEFDWMDGDALLLVSGLSRLKLSSERWRDLVLESLAESEPASALGGAVLDEVEPGSRSDFHARTDLAIVVLRRP